MTDEPRDPVTDDLRYLRDLDDAALLDHVQAQHLVAFAEGRIEDPAAAFVRDHVGRCEVCREALEVYRATARVETARKPGLWDLLRRTVLAPAPALAYLVVVAVGLVLWWGAPGPAVDAPGALPVTVTLYADDTLRGEERPGEVPSVSWQAGAPLVLILHTDIVPGDARGPLSVRVRSDEATILDHRVSVEGLPDDGVVSVTVPPAKIHEGAVFRVTAEAEGALPFAASFRID